MVIWWLVSEMRFVSEILGRFVSKRFMNEINVREWFVSEMRFVSGIITWLLSEIFVNETNIHGWFVG